VVSEACFSTNDPTVNATSLCPGGVPESTVPNSALHCNANDPSLNNAGCDHGTHVAGIASGNGASFTGVAPGSSIAAIQVFTKINHASTCSPQPTPCVLASESDLIKGMEHVLSLTGTFDIASVNVSLGEGSFTSTCDSQSPAGKTAIDNLRGAHVATVIGSGNDGLNNAVSIPACISTAVSVGSTTKTDISFADGSRIFHQFIYSGRRVPNL
jgi:hypothetical protein